MEAAPLPVSGPCSARNAWRSSREIPIPRDLIVAPSRVFDGYFRWRDPLPAAYYYGFERLAMRAWRRAARLIRPIAHLARTN
jgi:D-aspartate ligase